MQTVTERTNGKAKAHGVEATPAVPPKVSTVAIIGHSPSTREMAPYDDPNVETWTLNDAHTFLHGRRITRWFEIHSESVYRNPDRRTAGYLEALRTFGGPVYMRAPLPADIPNAVPYPFEMLRKYGRQTPEGIDGPHMSSGFSYMIALAFEEGFKRIEIYGADLMGEEEYRVQREGFAYLAGVARGMGIEFVIPKACPVLRPYLYGQNEPYGEGTNAITEDEISNWIAQARKTQAEANQKAVHAAGMSDAYIKMRARLGKW